MCVRWRQVPQPPSTPTRMAAPERSARSAQEDTRTGGLGDSRAMHGARPGAATSRQPALAPTRRRPVGSMRRAIAKRVVDELKFCTGVSFLPR